MTEKITYSVLIHPRDGSAVRSIAPKDITRHPSFKWSINQGPGSLNLPLRFSYDQDLPWLQYMSRIEIFGYSKEAPDGFLWFSGFIDIIERNLNSSSTEIIIKAASDASRLNLAYYTTSSATLSGAPENLINSIVAHHNTQTPNSPVVADLASNGGKLQATSTTILIEANEKSWAEAIESVRESIGGEWFTRVNIDGSVELFEKPSTPTHSFKLGRRGEVLRADSPGDIRGLVNSVIVNYDGGSITVEDSTSISNYEKRQEVINNNDIKDSGTATNLANQRIAESGSPQTKPSIEVSALTYPIHTIKPGDTCEILNVNEDAQVFDENMTIVSVTYKEDSATLEMGEDQDNFTNQMKEFVRRN